MSTRSSFAAGLAAALVAVWTASPAHAQWAPGGNAVCAAARSQVEVRTVADGHGGAIVSWADNRDGGWDLFAQRLDAAGQPRWAGAGVVVCHARGDQDPLCLVADGTGGAVLVWHDYRCGSALYAQRLDGDGRGLWTADGVALAASDAEQSGPFAVGDGAGGVIAYWQDGRGGFYGQRLDASGVTRWGAAGRAAPFGGSGGEALVADGARGAFVAYALAEGMFAQHVDSTGDALWPGGVTLCAVAGGVSMPTAVSDDAGGMIVAWADGRFGSHAHIFAQRAGPTGAALWGAGGVAACVANSDQNYPLALSDGAHGLLVAWLDARTSGRTGIYARRVDAAGDTLWAPQGTPVCTAAGNRTPPSLAPDGAGGAILAWADARGSSWDLYAQHLTHDGMARWTVDGDPVCTATGDQVGPVIVPDDHRGGIVAWADVRSDLAHVQAYAQRIDSAGAVPGNTAAPPPSAPGAFRLLPAAPNPSRGSVTIAFALPIGASVTAGVFDARGRLVRELARGAWLGAGRHALNWDGRDARGARAAPGIYFARIRAGAGEGRCRLAIVR